MSAAKDTRQFAEALLREAEDLVRQARDVEDVLRQRLNEAIAAEQAEAGFAPEPQRKPAMERLITLAELPARLGLTEAAIFHMIDNGAFPWPAVVGPIDVQWRLSDVRRWKRSRARGGHPAGRRLK